MVRNIQGKGKSSSLGHLNVNNEIVTSKKDISNTSLMHFRKIPLLKTILKNSKILNNRKKNELKDPLSKAHDSSPGPDGIHYQFLKYLPDSSLSVLLKTFNDIWESGNVPKSWKEATIILIPKPGKDNTNQNNYRLIALTSCICKTLERMINERLVWYLETNNIITEFESGFRHQRSTNDHLDRLETVIREAFIKMEYLIAVFVDLEKSYDTHGSMV